MRMRRSIWLVCFDDTAFVSIARQSAGKTGRTALMAL